MQIVSKVSVGKRALVAAFFVFSLLAMPKLVQAAPNEIDFEVTSNSVTEGGVVTFTFTTQRAAVGDIHINYQLTGEASAATDFTFNGSSSNTGFITIDNDSSIATVTLTTTQDALVENDESISFQIVSVDNSDDPEPAYMDFYDTGASLMLVDDDSTHKLSFTSTSSIMNEIEGPMFFGVALSNPAPVGGISFMWNTYVNSIPGPGYALLDTDFTGGSADWVSATIAEGESAVTIPFMVTDDNIDESEETVFMTIASPTGGATLGSITLKRYAIEDNDIAFASFASPTSSGAEEVSSRKAQVVLSNPSDHAVTVYVNTVPAQSTADVGADWQFNTTEYVIPAGELTKDVEIVVVDDSVEESDETATVRITSVGEGSVGPDTDHAFTILANDVPVPAAPVYGTAIPQSTAFVNGIPAGSIVVLPPQTSPVVVVPVVPVAVPVVSGEVLGVKVSRISELLAKLNQGQTSDEVTELQTELQKLGHFSSNFKPTRYYGIMTAGAVNKYMDDVVDSMSLDELVLVLKFGQRNNAVKKLQTELKSLGFFPANVQSTGYFGVITKAAVVKYLASR